MVEFSCRVPDSDFVKDKWLPLQVDVTRHLHINATDSSMINQKMIFHDRLTFWDGLLDERQ